MECELKFKIAEAEDGRRLGSVLRYGHGFSKTLIARLKHRPGSVLVDGAPARMTDRVNAGSSVRVTLEERDSAGGAEASFLPEVLYEDGGLIVINKPAGAKTHPAFGGDYSGTVAAAVLAYLGEGSFHPVTRLDTGTTGAMLIAKNGYMHSLMQRRLHTGQLEREYAAMVQCAPEPAEGVIDLPLLRGEDGRRRADPAGVRAVTHYRTLKVCADRSALLLLRLETGRTHQIRAHMSAVGCPLVGDLYYGAKVENGAKFDRPALHSCRLRFVHPLSGETVELYAKPPEDFERLCGCDLHEFL